MGAVSAKKFGYPPARAQACQRVAEPKPAQHPDSVWLQRDSGAHLSQGCSLLIDPHFDPAPKKCIRCR